MDFFEVLQSRTSIRIYSERNVEKNVLEQLVDAGRRAPTARNEQPWEFIIVTSTELLQTLGTLADHGHFINNAAACIGVYCKDTKYYLEDGSAATENILLAATALGLGACWVAGDKKAYCEKIDELLNVPSGYKLVSLIPIGYSINTSAPKTKRPLDEVLHWEQF